MERNADNNNKGPATAGGALPNLELDGEARNNKGGGWNPSLLFSGLTDHFVFVLGQPQELELLEIKLDGAALPWDGKAFVVTGDQDLLVFGASFKGRRDGMDWRVRAPYRSDRLTLPFPPAHT